MELLKRLQRMLDATRAVDFIAPLSLRLYLAPIFIYAGSNKLAYPDAVAQWFGSIGIPAPEIMVYVAGVTELVGGWCLVLGLGVRWFAVPLMFTMVVAAVTVHWQHGWHVLPETELTVPWEWRKDLIEGAVERKQRIMQILEECGNIDYLTETGPVTILKNGIEFAATYFIMLLTLFFIGAGRYVSIDYWIARRFKEA